MSVPRDEPEGLRSSRDTDLSLPDGVDRVAGDAGSLLLSVMRKSWEEAVLSRLDGDLQVRVGIKEHPFLQTDCLNA